MRAFYETVVEKMIAKFPFHVQTLADLAFLDPCRRRSLASTYPIVRLCKRFMSEDPSRIDEVVQQFLTFRVTPDHQLPQLDFSKEAAIDHFWEAMSNVHAVTDLSTLSFEELAKLAKVLLVLPHSNVDPERVFSMVSKVETKSRSQLNPSTTIDLLTVKMNHVEPCYACTNIVSKEFIDAAKTATRRSLQQHKDK